VFTSVDKNIDKRTGITSLSHVRFMRFVKRCVTCDCRVCVCVCLYIYIYIYARAHTHTHTYIYIYIYIYIYGKVIPLQARCGPEDG